MQTSTRIYERQLWNLPTIAPTTSSHYCPPFTLSSNGILTFATDNVVTLTQNVVFQPLCTEPASNGTRPDVSPFYASATPQVFVVAAAMVLAWVLVIMLVISPRTFLNNVDGGVSAFSVGRGIIGGANGGATSSVGVGSRPWLQKAAALTVAISLAIATADTFRVSEQHYPAGIDGNAMRSRVENSTEIKIIRVISDIFVLLAQVQTLIRIFPRHKEKVLIKWIGFALIILDITFSCLNSFLSPKNYRNGRNFVEAIPALSYLFELALSLLYSAWVIYYAFTKRRYAFYHPKMKTISIIALLALVAILTPTVFFVVDITFPNIAGWGDYFRWVGAAAASVVVWEWVERIEILERDEKKDGILGREIFEGDEMLDPDPTEEMTYHPRRNDSYFPRGHSGSGGTPMSITAISQKLSFSLPNPFRWRRTPKADPPKALEMNSRSTSSDNGKPSEESKDTSLGSLPRSGHVTHVAPRPTPPPPAVSPPSRTDTTSAASTVYVVRQDGTDSFQPVRRRMATPEIQRSGPLATATEQDETAEDGGATVRRANSNGWHGVPNPFKRKRTTPPAEVRAAMRASQDLQPNQATSTALGLAGAGAPVPKFRSRLNMLRPRSQSRNRDRAMPKKNTDDLPWTVIPAQPRGKTWLPSPVNEDPGQASPSQSPSPSPVTATSVGLNQGSETPRPMAPDRTPSSPRSPPREGTTPSSIDARLRAASSEHRDEG